MTNAFLVLIGLLSFTSPKPPAHDSTHQRWDFRDLTGWIDASQNMKGRINYSLQQDTLRIFTRKRTWDRPKVKTVDSSYTAGTYTWRIYIPAVGKGDRASIGAFLYQDDTHELDFETGYGTKKIRKQLGAAPDELIVYMTSQGFPFQSIPQKIKMDQWHSFSIKLTDDQGRYQATWSIDGEPAVRLPLGFGPETHFAIFCSMENLRFMGDHRARKNNYALFDYVEYSDH